MLSYSKILKSVLEADLSDHIITRNIDGSDGGDRLLPAEMVLAGRYMVKEVIGVGGMGAVYRARDLHFANAEKMVAVKEMINPTGDPIVRQAMIKNFEREANILVSLSHPSIPKIFDFFNQNERSYLVLELILGMDLEEMMSTERGFFPEEKVISWAVELCDVLHYLHDHKPEPIVFRDMKPSNVMINQYGRVVLVDFGIAKNFNTGQKGTMIGTEGYAPPEQYRGEATPMTDVYALGATLHHLLTRDDPRLQPPFTFSERPIGSINPAVSKGLEAVINKALSYNAQDRYQSTLEMKEALLASAKATGLLARVGTGGKRQQVQTQAVGPLWSFKCEDEIRGSPTYDRNMVYVGAYDNNLYAVNATDGKLAWKFPADGGIVSRPVASGDVVCFGSEDKRVYVISVRSGKIYWSYQTEGPIRSSPCVAAGHLFIGSDDGMLYALNLATGRSAWRLDSGSSIRSTISFYNDQLFFGCDSGEVICADLRGNVKWRFKAKRSVISSPLVDEGMVFFASLDTTFYAIDARSGWVVWRFRMGKGSISSPCKYDKYLFIGSADGNIYCIDETNGKEVWHFRTEHQVSGSPVIYNHAVYCGSADGNFYCLDSRSGRLRWKFATGGPITGSAFVNKEVLYFGSTDHHLYAISA